MKEPQFFGLLVRLPKAPGAPLAPVLSSTLRARGFQLEPLFITALPQSATGHRGVAPTAGWEWHVARATDSAKEQNPWEAAHSALSGQRGLAVQPDVFIEPDLAQDWIYENPAIREGLGFRAAADACVFNDQLPRLPRIPGVFAWHLQDDFSQLKAARQSAGFDGGSPIRIAHLDTGYDKEHSTFPDRVRLDLQKNFINDQAANDAHDPAARDTLKNPGHGTGTLGILAGRRFRFAAPGYQQFVDFVGGAPQAEIIPVRVGKSVVQLFTSSVAAGISYAAELCANESSRIHVMSMSMGGVASQAWADAVNKAYEAGIIYVAAAGNNFSAGIFGLPTRLIVYPARFRRVIAACGVMANAKPYYGLPAGVMQGNWGPRSKMATALAAFTPNIPWAELGCSGVVDMDGQGTSSATPQIAAGAALYLRKHAAALFSTAKYPEAWMRVEAVRKALFESADRSADGGSSEKLGNGILQAAAALTIGPASANVLRRTPPDSATFSFLNVFTGFGVAPPTPRDQMFALEATQLAQQWHLTGVRNPFDELIADPDLPTESISLVEQRAFLEGLLDHPRASRPLKQRIKEILSDSPKGPARGKRKLVERTRPTPATAKPKAKQRDRAAFAPTNPSFRRLRGFALDPSLSTELDTAPIGQVTFRVPWEKLQPGPVGEYLEVIDMDPASDCYYEPVDLDQAALLAQDGLPPSEGSPQFHQQMVYAVASLTIKNFEHALGRRTLWRPGLSPDPSNDKDDSVFVQRLRVHPHALRERNAFYSPQKVGLLFGYFRAVPDVAGEHMAGGMVFSCLSHDIIAHETTHALLDGMNRCFLTPTNPDVHAFHEAFADLVALFQHFTFPEILRHQISSTRGEIREQSNLLGQLAGQFGRGTGLRGALRDYIGKMENGEWKPHEPKPDEYENNTEAHARGAVLVAAVFDAFLSIYERRTADLVKLATGGTGILQPGSIHPDLVNRLAEQAAKAARHVLTMCVRALDYCPVVDITFGEFLRALITADCDLIAEDDLNYRIAFIQAFRKRGIYPRDVRTLSVESLLWRGPHNDECRPSPQLEAALTKLRNYADENAYTESREKTFHLERDMRRNIHGWLRDHFVRGPHAAEDASYLGIDPDWGFEVRTARFAYRTSPDGAMIPQLLLALLQRKLVPIDDADPKGAKMWFEGGCTLIADLRAGRIRFAIRKDLTSQGRLARQQQFRVQAADSLRATYFGSPRVDGETMEPFAALHRGV